MEVEVVGVETVTGSSAGRDTVEVGVVEVDAVEVDVGMRGRWGLVCCHVLVFRRVDLGQMDVGGDHLT